MAQPNIISLKIQNTEKTIYEGKVDRISSNNEVGPFDIYPMHANFISIIQKTIQVYANSRLIKTFNIDQAILKAKKDRVDIFVGIESLLLKEEAEIKNISKS